MQAEEAHARPGIPKYGGRRLTCLTNTCILPLKQPSCTSFTPQTWTFTRITYHLLTCLKRKRNPRHGSKQQHSLSPLNFALHNARSLVSSPRSWYWEFSAVATNLLPCKSSRRSDPAITVLGCVWRVAILCWGRCLCRRRLVFPS